MNVKMSEEIIVSRKTAILLGLIFTVLVVCLVSVLVNYTLMISEKNSEISSLKTKIRELQDLVDKLNSTLRAKDSQISSLNSTYYSLKRDYDKLISIIEDGEAIAKSATWISEDGRLRVTSEVIPEFSRGKLLSYTVKVTVTNIGVEPISKVWIILFPYKGDRLIEYWSPYSYSKSVENLYIGESYSYNFTKLPKYMTTYKVIAVAGENGGSF
jgi:hypothetical protein